MDLTNNLGSVTKSASTTEQLNNVIFKTIADMEEQGYEVTDTSTASALLKSVNIVKKKGYDDEEIINITLNYIFTKDVNCIKEEL